MGVVVFIRVRWVHSGAPWWSSGSFGFDELIRARPVASVVHADAPWGRWVDSSAPWVHLGWLGSFGCAVGVAGFIQARPWSRLVH